MLQVENSIPRFEGGVSESMTFAVLKLFTIKNPTGLFDPGEIPSPTMENWLRNLEAWETPAKGTKRTSDVN